MIKWTLIELQKKKNLSPQVKFASFYKWKIRLSTKKLICVEASFK